MHVLLLGIRIEPLFFFAGFIYLLTKYSLSAYNRPSSLLGAQVVDKKYLSL